MCGFANILHREPRGNYTEPRTISKSLIAFSLRKMLFGVVLALGDVETEYVSITINTELKYIIQRGFRIRTKKLRKTH